MGQPEGGRAPGRVHCAMVLGLDDGDPRLARDSPAEARSGDPAADDDDVEVAHVRPRLRIRKARRLEPDAMLYGAFTEILLVGLAAILVVAAVIDVRTFTIS